MLPPEEGTGIENFEFCDNQEFWTEIISEPFSQCEYAFNSSLHVQRTNYHLELAEPRHLN
jgi:hypothetical protein